MRKTVAGIVALAVVFVGLVTGSVASADAPNTKPITVVTHAFTPAFWDAVRTCAGDAHYAAADSVVAKCEHDLDNGVRCTRVELSYVDGRSEVITDEC